MFLGGQVCGDCVHFKLISGCSKILGETYAEASWVLQKITRLVEFLVIFCRLQFVQYLKRLKIGGNRHLKTTLEVSLRPKEFLFLGTSSVYYCVRYS